MIRSKVNGYQEKVKKQLFGKENGFLNKRFFTSEDRENVKNALALAVILNAIFSKRGPELCKDPLYDYIEKANVNALSQIIRRIRERDDFKTSVPEDISPDQLRKFFMDGQLDVLAISVRSLERGGEENDYLASTSEISKEEFESDLNLLSNESASNNDSVRSSLIISENLEEEEINTAASCTIPPNQRILFGDEQTRQEVIQNLDKMEERFKNTLLSESCSNEDYDRRHKNLVDWASEYLPPTVNCLSDPEKIMDCIRELQNGDYENKYYIFIEHLQNRCESMKKIKKCQDERDLDRKNKRCIMKHGKKEGCWRLDTKYNVEKQTSTNGCWSCVLLYMLQNFGVKHLTQEDIRNYRPEFNQAMLTDEKSAHIYNKMVQDFSKDTEHEISEVADLIHRTVPNVALRHVEIDAKDDPDVQKKFLDMVKFVLFNNKSPLAISKNGHYTAIVGINGDELLIQDPKFGGTSVFSVSVAQFFEKEKSFRISVEWLQDITFTKEGKFDTNTHNMKCSYIECKDGKFNPYGEGTYLTHCQSYILDEGNDKNNFGGMVYLPKQSYQAEIGQNLEKTEIVPTEPSKPDIGFPEEIFSA